MSTGKGSILTYNGGEYARDADRVFAYKSLLEALKGAYNTYIPEYLDNHDTYIFYMGGRVSTQAELNAYHKEDLFYVEGKFNILGQEPSGFINWMIPTYKLIELNRDIRYRELRCYNATLLPINFTSQRVYICPEGAAHVWDRDIILNRDDITQGLTQTEMSLRREAVEQEKSSFNYKTVHMVRDMYVTLRYSNIKDINNCLLEDII